MNYKEQSKELKGKRILCIFMDDKYGVAPETEGTITGVDDIGTIHVEWDNGSSLGLVPGVDKYRIL